MTNIINWNLCKSKFIRTIERDDEKIASIIETSDKRLAFIKSNNVTKENISFIVEGYYEIIKELLVALLLKNGLKSSNHQCLISFFYKEHPDHEFETNLISQMSYLRNRLNYYGEQIDFEFYNKHKEEFDKIIVMLKKLISN
jgi:uncharacterized protein (UPF0332 family)|tara:strand:+ start:2863 stop:3288 length:426 start_codon:yes stop_codon:yes gene_type:complete